MELVKIIKENLRNSSSHSSIDAQNMTIATFINLKQKPAFMDPTSIAENTVH